MMDPVGNEIKVVIVCPCHHDVPIPVRYLVHRFPAVLRQLKRWYPARDIAGTAETVLNFSSSQQENWGCLVTASRRVLVQEVLVILNSIILYVLRLALAPVSIRRNTMPSGICFLSYPFFDLGPWVRCVWCSSLFCMHIRSVCTLNAIITCNERAESIGEIMPILRSSAAALGSCVGRGRDGAGCVRT